MTYHLNPRVEPTHAPFNISLHNFFVYLSPHSLLCPIPFRFSQHNSLHSPVERGTYIFMGTHETNPKSSLRGHWRPSEDEKLRQLVEKFGPHNWNSIAEKLNGRSGKSCRLRWFNQLDPRINRRPFSKEEEERLIAAHRVHGNKWAFIARLFPGRTDNAVKNHWHVITARRSKEQSWLSKKKNLRNYLHASSLLEPREAANFSNNILFRSHKLFLPSQSNLLSSCFYLHENYKLGNIYNPQYDQVVPPLNDQHSCSDDVRLANDSAKLMTVGRNQHEDEYEVLRPRKDVPFIDFLGVGIKS